MIKKNPNKQIAKKDITCWKVLRLSSDGVLWSPHYPVIYKQGKLKTSKIEMDNYYSIGKGLHSFTTRLQARAEKSWFEDNYYLNKYKVVKCMIPAGSSYYVNKLIGEYVSNKIIML